MGIKGVSKRHWAIAGAIAAALLAVVLVLVLVLGGGSGDDDNLADLTPPEPKKTAPQAERTAYIEQVDPVCRRYNRAIGRVNRRMSDATDDLRHDGAYVLVSGLAPYLEDLEKLTEESNAAFVSVTPPAGDKAVIDQLTELNDLQLSMTSSLVDYSAQRAPGQFRTASTKLKEIVVKRDEIAADYGFKYCGRDTD